MCTVMTMNNGDFYFGRNMDVEYSFGEKVVAMPRNFPISYKCKKANGSHFAMIGMAAVINDYPLYAEAINEKGLCVAGLNFPNFAKYSPDIKENAENITPYEIIPWLLATCEDVPQARKLLEKINIVAIPFAANLALAPLHWCISDENYSIVLESTEDGVKIHENPVGVMTNNPTFDFHMTNLRNYIGLSPKQPANNLCDGLKPLGQGLGSFGLPGDLSPTSRFIRTVFTKLNSVCPKDEDSNISQFFHILDNSAMVRGTVITESGLPDITSYASCINVTKGIYYYKTYDNNQINGIDMNKTNINSDKLEIFPLVTKQNINMQN